MQRALRRDPIGRRHPVLVESDDDDPSKIVAEHPTDGNFDLPTTGVAGYRFVEEKLGTLLR